jgi:hypothetical protein
MSANWVKTEAEHEEYRVQAGIAGRESQLVFGSVTTTILTGSGGTSWLFYVLKPVLTRWKPTVFARFGLSMNRFFVNDIAPFHFRTKYIGSVRRS